MNEAVEVDGLLETQYLLKKLKPEALKEMNRELGAIQRELKGKADANFSATGASGGYKLKSINRADSLVRSVETVGGSVPRGQKWSTKPGVLAQVFELMANVRTSNPKHVQRVQSLIATLSAKYGAPGRFLWQAYDDMGGDAVVSARSREAIARAEAALTEELKA